MPGRRGCGPNTLPSPSNLIIREEKTSVIQSRCITVFSKSTHSKERHTFSRPVEDLCLQNLCSSERGVCIGKTVVCSSERPPPQSLKTHTYISNDHTATPALPTRRKVACSPQHPYEFSDPKRINSTRRKKCALRGKKICQNDIIMKYYND